MPNLTHHLIIILTNPSHPGNIGAVARAMKNMELHQLRLVKPKRALNKEAYARASGANDVLDNAQYYETLTEALADCHLVIGTSARTKVPSTSLLTPKDAAALALTNVRQQHLTAFVFGREHAGLTNDELALCHHYVQIPCNPDFSSLNLGAAVQVLAYELHSAFMNIPSALFSSEESLASQHEVEKFFEHFGKTLTDLDFYDPKNPRRLMPKLRALFNRTQLLKSEVNILRGILTAINKKL